MDSKDEHSIQKCPSCLSRNQPDAKFCQNCGEQLGWICPDCSTQNLVEARYCKSCGVKLDGFQPPDHETRLNVLQRAAPKGLQEKVSAARTEIDGAHKPVTILEPNMASMMQK